MKIGAETFHCQFENAEGTVEPRRIARGNLARSVFYMCEEYGCPAEAAMLDILQFRYFVLAAHAHFSAR